MAVAAIDDSGGARHARKPYISWQREVSIRHRCRRAERRAHRGRPPASAASGKGFALVVERARPYAEVGSVDRAPHCGEFDAGQPRREQPVGQASPPAAKPAVAARKPRLFNIGTGFLAFGRTSQETLPGPVAGYPRLELRSGEGLSFADEQSFHREKTTTRMQLPTSASAPSARIATW